MKSPAFRFYADDFLAGTYHMTQSEVGAYIRLLCVQWSRGSIPDPLSTGVQPGVNRGSTEPQPDILERLAGGPVSAEVLAKFVPMNGVLKNLRLESEREKQTAYSLSQSEKGKKSAQSRSNGYSTGVQPGFNRASGSTEPQVQPSASVSVSASVSATATDSSERAGAKRRSNSIDDGEFIAGLKTEAAYAGIDIDRELGKCRQWCLANNCTATRRRFVNWLNRARPVGGSGRNGHQPSLRNSLICGSDEWDRQCAEKLARVESGLEEEGFGVGRGPASQSPATGPVG